jgi:twitching motility two-component system response regulator PilH
VDRVDRFLPEGLRGRRPAQVESTETEAPRPRPPPRRGAVLVVDDSPTNLHLVHEILVHFGYEVWLASGVQEAIAILDKKLPDLILSDLHMPGGYGGVDLLEHLKNDPRFAALPVILCSSSLIGERERSMAMKLDVSRFLLRPMEPQVLVDAIEGCLGHNRNGDNGHDPRR